jgi:diadenosine tetraphosphate (Ap4A) HIT family hydrolase
VNCWSSRGVTSVSQEETKICPFCAPDAAHVFHRGRLVMGLWDAFPVSPGHALLVPLRHFAERSPFLPACSLQ